MKVIKDTGNNDRKPSFLCFTYSFKVKSDRNPGMLDFLIAIGIEILSKFHLHIRSRCYRIASIPARIKILSKISQIKYKSLYHRMIAGNTSALHSVEDS